jgi:iron(III) transport system permease protein
MPKSKRQKNLTLLLAGLLFILGVASIVLGFMGKAQVDFFSRRLNMTTEEWVEYAQGKPVPELTDSDYKGRNLTESGKQKKALQEYIDKLTDFDHFIMPARYVLVGVGIALSLLGAFLLVRREIWPLVTVTALLFYLFFLIYPLASLLKLAIVNNDGTITYEYFQRMFSRAYYTNAIWHSVLISSVVTVAAVLIATPMAYIMSTTVIRGAGFLQILILVSSMSAPFIGAYAWIQLAGRNGVITNLLASVGIKLGDIYGFKGCVIVMSFQLYSLVFMFIQGAFKSLDASLIEASESLGCVGLRKVFKVVLPLLLPTILAGALLVFMRAFADYGTPMLIGENYITLPVLVYKEFFSEIGGSTGLAAAVSVIAIIITATMFLVQKYIVSRKVFSISALRPVEKKKVHGWRNTLAHLYCYIMVGIAIMPQCYVIFNSFRNTSGRMFAKGFSLNSYKEAFKMVSRSIWMTYLLAGISIVCIVILAYLFSYVIVRRRNILNATVDIMSMFPEMVAGSILGFALLTSFNKRPLLLSGGMFIMVLSYTLRRLPYTVRSSSAILRNIPMSIEEASISLGASGAKTFWAVTMPMMAPGVISGAILSWITIITELSTSIMLYTTNTKTMTLEIYSQVIRGNDGVASAISAILTFSTIIALALFFKVSGKKEISM